MNPTFRRQGKTDRLLTPTASANEIRCDSVVAPLTRVADHYDLIWGADRLPELVSVSTAEKFGRATAHLYDCLDREDPAAAAAAVANCIKALHVLDAEARALGHKPSPVIVWQAEYEAQRIGVIRDVADQARAMKDNPGVMIVTMREVAVAMHHYRYALVNADIVKAAFPGAEIGTIRPMTKLEMELGDTIPF